MFFLRNPNDVFHLILFLQNLLLFISHLLSDPASLALNLISIFYNSTELQSIISSICRHIIPLSWIMGNVTHHTLIMHIFVPLVQRSYIIGNSKLDSLLFSPNRSFSLYLGALFTNLPTGLMPANFGFTSFGVFNGFALRFSSLSPINQMLKMISHKFVKIMKDS